MNISRILNSELGTFIVSILLGLGLATLFRKSCRNDRCRVFRAPNPMDIEKKTYKFDNNCYKYNFEAGRCDGNKRIVEFL